MTTRPALVVGLTGGIGTGKSAVAALLRGLGVPVIDADAVAREVVSPGEPALAEIAARLGERFIDANGELDRARLRAHVFEHDAQRRLLESILHPRIRARIRERLEALDDDYAVVEIPLLVESGRGDLVDRVLVVDADPHQQVLRATARDGTDRGDVERIMAAQVDRATRLAAADDVLVNDRGLAELGEATRALHERYRQVARQREESTGR